MIQNLANKPSYAKEQYMASLNPFVEENKARMNAFHNSLCEVGDFYESLEVSWLRLADSKADKQLDQYMALSKKDLQIHITLNELYNTHSLLVQHADVLVCPPFFSSPYFTDHRHLAISNICVSS